MDVSIVGLLHPGEMGSAVGSVLRSRGIEVLWASEGRTAATRERAERAGLRDVGSVAGIEREADLVLSLCPPHAARDVAASLAGYEGLYVDANAVAPATARAIGAGFRRFVDGGVVGPPPVSAPTRFYLSGDEAESVAAIFEGTLVDARIVSNASAVKCAYAAWTKGTAALLLAIRDFAQAEGVDEALLLEWEESIPELPERLAGAERSAAAKGWRWVGEMEEIAVAFAAHGLPSGFHEAAAEIYRD
jgi:3-hydroxyisobutyrate dehydrogenase-like beta-hydroxyacid dehydrogenase